MRINVGEKCWRKEAEYRNIIEQKITITSTIPLDPLDV